MNASRLTSLLVVVLASLVGGTAGKAHAQFDPRIDGLMIVMVNNGFTIDDFITDFESTFPHITADPLDQIDSRPIHLLELSGWGPGDLDFIEENYLKPTPPPMIKWGELEYEGQAPEGKTGSTWVGYIGDNFELQYGLGQIGAGQAQQRSTGDGVTVAVLDTGIDPTHPFFGGRVRGDGYNFIHDNTNTDDVGDGVDNDGDGDIDEMVGHGTFVAGLVALVAPEAELLPVVVLNSDGVGTLWSFTEGIFFAIDRGARVINMSLSSTYSSDAVEEGLSEAKSRGIITVGAAGNIGWDEREFPACKSDAFGVAALDHNDVKADFSNYNKKLFISAPGASLDLGGGQFDPDRSIIGTLPDGGYGLWEGTSFAVPFVSGSVALLRARHPELPDDESTWNAIEAMLEHTAVDIYAQNPQYAPDEELGVGRIDIGAAVQSGLPTAFAVTAGVLQGGTVDDLQRDDDEYVVIQQRAPVTPLLPAAEIEIEATALYANPLRIVYSVEAAATALPANVPQVTALRNFATNNWVIVDERLATRTDSTVTAAVTQNPSSYIQPGTSRMRSRSRWFDPGMVLFAAWGVRVDRAVWTLVPVEDP